MHRIATEAFSEGLAVRRDLAKRLGTPQSLRGLSTSLNDVDRVAHISGNHEAAADAFGESLDVARDLARRLKTPESRRDLSMSLNNVGRAAQAAGDHSTAAEVFEESLTLARDLAERLKTSESLRDLCVILRLRCSLALLMSDNDLARLLLDVGEVVLAKLPDLIRAEEGAAFDDLEKRLSAD